MNFMGMGTLEILIVLLIAFVFLGPERMVDAARVMGKLVRDARRMIGELPRIDLEEADITPLTRSPGGQGGSTAVGPSAGEPSSDAASQAGGAESGPVAFRPGATQPVDGQTDPSSSVPEVTDEERA